MVERILVINPNSTEAVTQGIDEACVRLRIPGARSTPPLSKTWPM